MSSSVKLEVFCDPSKLLGEMSPAKDEKMPMSVAQVPGNTFNINQSSQNLVVWSKMFGKFVNFYVHKVPLVCLDY